MVRVTLKLSSPLVHGQLSMGVISTVSIAMAHIIRLVTPPITTLNPIEPVKNPKPLPVNLQVSPKAALRFLFNSDFVDRGTRSVPWSENEVGGFISFWELGLVGQLGFGVPYFDTFFLKEPL